jgi:hypothetical protein
LGKIFFQIKLSIPWARLEAILKVVTKRFIQVTGTYYRTVSQHGVYLSSMNEPSAAVLILSPVLLLLLLLVKILFPLCRVFIRTCTYIPETNHVRKEYNVATILSLLFMVPVSLAPALTLMSFYFSTF